MPATMAKSVGEPDAIRDACVRNSLNGKVALITGASTGIGLASAHELAAEGVRLFITGRRGHEIADAARAIGRGTVGVQADVSNLTDLDRLYEQISRDAGRLDVVFGSPRRGARQDQVGPRSARHPCVIARIQHRRSLTRCRVPLRVAWAKRDTQRQSAVPGNEETLSS